MNPIEQGFVTNPIDWKYSSAINYTEDETILKSENGCLRQQGV